MSVERNLLLGEKLSENDRKKLLEEEERERRRREEEEKQAAGGGRPLGFFRTLFREFMPHSLLKTRQENKSGQLDSQPSQGTDVLPKRIFEPKLGESREEEQRREQEELRKVERELREMDVSEQSFGLPGQQERVFKPLLVDEGYESEQEELAAQQGDRLRGGKRLEQSHATRAEMEQAAKDAGFELGREDSKDVNNCFFGSFMQGVNHNLIENGGEAEPFTAGQRHEWEKILRDVAVDDGFEKSGQIGVSGGDTPDRTLREELKLNMPGHELYIWELNEETGKLEIADVVSGKKPKEGEKVVKVDMLYNGNGEEGHFDPMFMDNESVAEQVREKAKEAYDAKDPVNDVLRLRGGGDPDEVARLRGLAEAEAAAGNYEAAADNYAAAAAEAAMDRGPGNEANPDVAAECYGFAADNYEAAGQGANGHWSRGNMEAQRAHRFVALGNPAAAAEAYGNAGGHYRLAADSVAAGDPAAADNYAAAGEAYGRAAENYTALANPAAAAEAYGDAGNNYENADRNDDAAGAYGLAAENYRLVAAGEAENSVEQAEAYGRAAANYTARARRFVAAANPAAAAEAYGNAAVNNNAAARIYSQIGDRVNAVGWYEHAANRYNDQAGLLGADPAAAEAIGNRFEALGNREVQNALDPTNPNQAVAYETAGHNFAQSAAQAGEPDVVQRRRTLAGENYARQADLLGADPAAAAVAYGRAAEQYRIAGLQRREREQLVFQQNARLQMQLEQQRLAQQDTTAAIGTATVPGVPGVPGRPGTGLVGAVEDLHQAQQDTTAAIGTATVGRRGQPGHIAATGLVGAVEATGRGMITLNTSVGRVEAEQRATTAQLTDIARSLDKTPDWRDSSGARARNARGFLGLPDNANALGEDGDVHINRMNPFYFPRIPAGQPRAGEFVDSKKVRALKFLVKTFPAVVALPGYLFGKYILFREIETKTFKDENSGKVAYRRVGRNIEGWESARRALGATAALGAIPFFLHTGLFGIFWIKRVQKWLQDQAKQHGQH